MHNMEVENDKVIEKYYLNLVEFSAKVSEEEKNQLFQWVMPLHLDDVEILVYELPHMLKNQLLVLKVFCSKKFIARVLAKT